MATAIGDLVVTLGCDNNTFVAALNTSGASLDEFAAHTGEGSRGLHKMGEAGEEAGGSIAGASRSFRFLGKSISEAGEAIGGTNSALGETAGGLGTTVSGLGEAVHGYHALHTVMDLAIVKQIALNALSPVGLVVMAGAAIAGAAAYTAWGGAIAEWWEKRKKAAEEEKEANSEVESTLKNLQKEADKLNSTPLQHFQSELEKTGKSAEAIAEATRKFKELSAEVAKGEAAKKAAEEGKRIEEQLAHKSRELSESGMSAGQKFGADFEAEHPHATAAQRAQAEALGQREDDLKNQARLQKEMDAERQKAEEKVASIVHSLETPMDRLIADAKELRESHSRGLISDADYSTAMAALQTKGEKETAVKEKAKDDAPAAALDFGSAQAYEAIYKAMNPEENQPAKQTAENTAKMHVLLGEIADGLKNTVRLGS